MSLRQRFVRNVSWDLFPLGTSGQISGLPPTLFLPRDGHPAPPRSARHRRRLLCGDPLALRRDRSPVDIGLLLDFHQRMCCP